MTSTKPQFLLRFFPSLTDFIFLTPILILYGLGNGAHGFLADGDTAWHIRTGDWILKNGRIPHTDLFSFTLPGKPWFAWEWLWDVIAAWLHQHWGMQAVVLANTLLICLTAVLLFRLVRRKCGNDLLAFVVTLLAVAGASGHWLARPLLITPFFCVVFLSVLERAREGKTRRLVLLPLFTILWSNLHGGFLAGLTLIAAYAGGELLAWLTAADDDQRNAALKRSVPYLLTGVCCLVASVANPYGYHLHVHIFRYLADPFYREHIAEFRPTNFQDPDAIFLEIMLFAGAVAVFTTLRRKEFVYLLIFAIWSHLALTSVRHVPIFMIVSSPFVAYAVHEVLLLSRESSVARWIRSAIDAFEKQAAEFGATDRVGRFHITSALALLVVGAVLYAPAPPSNFRAEFDPAAFPVQAVDVIQQRHLPGNIFATDRWGGYLIYRLYPSTKVFIDGRSDFYGPAFVRKYLEILNVSDGWEDGLRKYGVDTVLVPVNAPLARMLKVSGWRVVHDDGLAIVFQRA